MAAVLYTVSRNLRLSQCELKLFKPHRRFRFSGKAHLSTSNNVPPNRILQSNMGVLLGGIGAGIFCGTLYTMLFPEKTNSGPLEAEEAVNVEHELLPSLPDTPISRVVKYENDKSGLDLVLFQYNACPFCSKVRAFLDYFGISYKIVEVNPVFRKETKWTKYNKVPILLVKTNEGYWQINDSSLIISVLTSYLYDKKLKMKDTLDYYPMMQYTSSSNDNKTDILNKYFLMFQEKTPKGKMYESVKNERKWRQWVDDVLVHAVTPNIYRTPSESLQAFNLYSELGQWEKLFSTIERNVVIYVGAAAMWIISKRLKKRHGLKDDVRESIYDECKNWMNAVKTNGKVFLGGNAPNLADLAVYGVMSSIEGCDVFQDIVENTSFGKWYYPMKKVVTEHGGKPESIMKNLHNF